MNRFYNESGYTLSSSYFLFYFLKLLQRFAWQQKLKLKLANLAMLPLDLNLGDTFHGSPPECFSQVWYTMTGIRGPCSPVLSQVYTPVTVV